MSRTTRMTEANRNTMQRKLYTSVTYRARQRYSMMLEAYDQALDEALEEEQRMVEAARKLVLEMARQA